MLEATKSSQINRQLCLQTATNVSRRDVWQGWKTENCGGNRWSKAQRKTEVELRNGRRQTGAQNYRSLWDISGGPGGMRDQERAAFSPCVFLKIESVDRPAFQPEAADTWLTSEQRPCCGKSLTSRFRRKLATGCRSESVICLLTYLHLQSYKCVLHIATFKTHSTLHTKSDKYGTTQAFCCQQEASSTS